MARVHSGGGMRAALRSHRQIDAPNDLRKFSARNTTRPQQYRPPALPEKSPSIQFPPRMVRHPDVIHVFAQAAAHMFGSRWRKFRKAVRAGRRHRHTRSAYQLERNGMGGHAQADRPEPGRRNRRNRIRFRQNEGQRSGPEFSRESIGCVRPSIRSSGQRPRHLNRRDMHD